MIMRTSTLVYKRSLALLAVASILNIVTISCGNHEENSKQLESKNRDIGKTIKGEWIAIFNSANLDDSKIGVIRVSILDIDSNLGCRLKTIEQKTYYKGTPISDWEWGINPVVRTVNGFLEIQKMDSLRNLVYLTLKQREKVTDPIKLVVLSDSVLEQSNVFFLNVSYSNPRTTKETISIGKINSKPKTLRYVRSNTLQSKRD